MKVSDVKAETIQAEDAHELTTRLNVFFADGGEKVFLSCDFQMIDGKYSALILYTT